MAAIGSRFNSLLLNAQDPLEKSKKSSKKGKEGKPSKINIPKSSHQRPMNEVVSEELRTREANNSPNEESRRAKNIKVVVRDVKQEVVEDFTEADNFEHDPKNRNYGSHQKMISTRGRTFDRHGTRVQDRGHEKRHGKGAFNWGEQGDVSGNIEDPSVNEAPKEPKESKEEYVDTTITLYQYRRMVNSNEIDPLRWEVQTTADKVIDEKDDFRQYEYNYNQNAQRGRGRFRGQRGGVSRGRGAFGRQSRGDRQSPREKSAPLEVKVDDINDFPAL